MNHVGTDAAGDGTDPVGDPHEDAGVPRGDVQMVDVEPRNCEPAEGNSDGKRGHTLCRGVRVGHDDEERGFHAETPAVEQLPDLGGVEKSFFAQAIRQDPPTGDYDGHQQMRKGAQEAVLER